MGDRLRVGKLSRYVTSHPGQLSLAIRLWVGMLSTSLGWEGNRIGLASHWPCVTDNSGLSTYGLNGLWKGDEHPAYAPEYGPPLPLSKLQLAKVGSFFETQCSVGSVARILGVEFTVVYITQANCLTGTYSFTGDAVIRIVKGNVSKMSFRFCMYRCVCVCVCVCVWIVSKRINISSKFFHCRVATQF